MKLRSAAIPVALALLVVAAVTPPSIRPAPEPWLEDCRRGYTLANGRQIMVFCSTAILDLTQPRPPDYVRYPAEGAPLLPYLPSVYAAIPTDLRVDGRPGCDVRQVGTTEPVTLSARFATVLGPPPAGAVFEYGGDDRGLNAPMDGPGGRSVLTIDRGELAPGDTIRWRVRAAWEFDRLYTWSPWCSFTVAATAPDLRGLDDTEIEAMLELGLRPERRYTVTLTRAQWRTALEPFGIYLDIGVLDEVGPYEPGYQDEEIEDLATGIRPQLPGPITLTGAQWSTFTSQLAQWPAYDSEEPTDPAVYWAVLDQISTRLGGPPHPRLGSR